MGVIDNLGYIASASYYPCAAPQPALIIQAAGAAAFPVLMSAVSFGCTDIVKMRAGVSPWHARNLKAMIKGAIPPEQIDAANKILKYTVPIEKLLFFWFVVDLTDSFLAKWQSNIFKLNACGNNSIMASDTGELASWVEPAPGAWTDVNYHFTHSNPGHPIAAGAQFIIPPDFYWSAYFSVTPKPLFVGQPLGGFQTRLRRIAPTVIDYESPLVTPPWIGNQMTSSLHIAPQKKKGFSQSYTFQAQADGIAIGTSGSALVQISETPIGDDNIIPVNCFGAAPPTAQAP